MTGGIKRHLVFFYNSMLHCFNPIIQISNHISSSTLTSSHLFALPFIIRRNSVIVENQITLK